MFALLTDPANWVALGTLTVLEIVLGIDNVVFISVLVSRLPKAAADRARRIGLTLALLFRIALLLVLSWIIGLTQPVITAFGVDLSWKDLILIGGGAFLVYKATHEIHKAVEEAPEEMAPKPSRGSFAATIAQIVLVDMVFSIDSIVTAIGLAQHIEVMVAAVIIAVGIMYAASGTVSGFIARHPTTKMLALAFLLVIGVTLVADGLGFHIDKGYIYAAMAFSTLVESINIFARQRRTAAKTQGGAPAEKAPRSLPADAPVASVAESAAAPKRRSTSASRAQARPKSAPRQKTRP